MNRVTITALLLFTACQSVSWAEPTSTTTWRGMSLRENHLGGFLATSESDAIAVHDRWARIVRSMQDAGLTVGEPPLLLVVGADDSPMCGDVATTEATYQRWLGVRGARSGPGDAGLKDLTREEEDLLHDCAVRMMAVEPPRDAPELALPAVWQQRFAWVLVVPSDDGMAAAVDRMLDLGLAKSDLSWGKRLLIAPMLPFARRQSRQQMGGFLDAFLLTAALQRLPKAEPAAVTRCCQVLGLNEDLVRQRLQPGQTEGGS